MSVIKADGVRPFKKIRLSVGTKYFDCENFYLNSIETAAIKLIFYCTEPVTTGGVEYPTESFFIAVVQNGPPTNHLKYSENLSETSVNYRTKKPLSGM